MQSSASTFNWKRLCLSCHRSLVRKVEPDSFNFDERLQGCPISPTITCAQPHALPCFPSGHSWVTQSVTDRKSHVMLPRHTVTSVSTPLLPASWWLGPPGCPSPPLDLHWVGGGRRHEGSEGGHGLADGLDRQVLGVGPHVVGPRPPTTGSAHHHHGHHGHGRSTSSVATIPPPAPSRTRACSSWSLTSSSCRSLDHGRRRGPPTAPQARPGLTWRSPTDDQREKRWNSGMHEADARNVRGSQRCRHEDLDCLGRPGGEV